ncbi:hypothetical protein BSL78_19335 [Apostichopus japonicus]|uniref:Protein kinase domain-containing protein n=1 Tax=Stichopus japonicus TaxID=307972 RepID=A0A2G8K785_STIJA|nr:hypothetical protein BSL78_19335 [Apostichopus japonicus]
MGKGLAKASREVVNDLCNRPNFIRLEKRLTTKCRSRDRRTRENNFTRQHEASFKRGKEQPKSPKTRSKGRRKKDKESSNARKLLTSLRNREVNLIQPINDTDVQKWRPHYWKQPQTFKPRDQSRDVDFKNVSVIIKKYAKSISLSTLQSLSPDGKESLTDTFKRHKGLIESLVKSQAYVPPERATAYRIDKEFDHLQNSQLSLGQICDINGSPAGPHNAALQSLATSLNFSDQKRNINFAKTVARGAICVPRAALQNSSVSPESYDVTRIPPNVTHDKIKTGSKGDVNEIIQRAPTQPHSSSTQTPTPRELPTQCRALITPKEKAPKHRPKLTTAKQDGDVSRVDELVASGGKKLELDGCAAKPPKVPGRRIKDARQHVYPKGNPIQKRNEPLNCREIKNILVTRLTDGDSGVVRLSEIPSGKDEIHSCRVQDNSSNHQTHVRRAEKDIARVPSVGQGVDVLHSSSDVRVEAGPKNNSTAIKSKLTHALKNIQGQTTPAKIKSTLQRLFPECELLSQSDLQHVLHPVTNKSITLGKGAYGVEAKLEVQTLTKLRGLNCVAELFGIVPTEGNVGVPSVVEEFIGDAKTFKASTLHAALKSSILSAAAMFRIALNIVNALNDVHSRGVLHCDLKTDNIMLMPGFEHQRDPQIKIIDFGEQFEWTRNRSTSIIHQKSNRGC